MLATSTVRGHFYMHLEASTSLTAAAIFFLNQYVKSFSSLHRLSASRCVRHMCGMLCLIYMIKNQPKRVLFDGNGGSLSNTYLLASGQVAVIFFLIAGLSPERSITLSEKRAMAAARDRQITDPQEAIWIEAFPPEAGWQSAEPEGFAVDMLTFDWTNDQPLLLMRQPAEPELAPGVRQIWKDEGSRELQNAIERYANSIGTDSWTVWGNPSGPPAVLIDLARRTWEVKPLGQQQP